MRYFKFVIVWILGLCLLAGCSSPKHKPAELVKFEPAITVNRVWSKGMGTPAAHLVPKVYSGSTWVAGGKTVAHLSARTGSTEWSTSLGDEITGGVGSDGYITAVGLANGELIALDDQGHIAWTQKLTTELASPPTVAGGMVIVRTRDMRISAFGASTGNIQWIYQRSQPALTVDVPTYLTCVENMLFAGQPNGHVIVIDITNGRQVFEFPAGQAKGSTEVERLIDVIGAPTLSEDMLCAAAYQGAITCINVFNGALRWTQNVSAVSGPAIDDENVYVVDTAGVVHAFYRESGEPRWTNDEMTYRGMSFPVVLPGTVAVGDNEGYLHFLSPRTGKLIARTRLSGAIVSQGQSFDDGAIFQTENGEVAYLTTR